MKLMIAGVLLMLLAPRLVTADGKDSHPSAWYDSRTWQTDSTGAVIYWVEFSVLTRDHRRIEDFGFFGPCDTKVGIGYYTVDSVLVRYTWWTPDLGLHPRFARLTQHLPIREYPEGVFAFPKLNSFAEGWIYWHPQSKKRMVQLDGDPFFSWPIADRGETP